MNITLLTGAKNKHCGICDITFSNRINYLDFHITKETPVIDLKTFCCNICDESYTTIAAYRRHMANLNYVHVLLIKRSPKPDSSKTPDIKDPNTYCVSCNFKSLSRNNYY